MLSAIAPRKDSAQSSKEEVEKPGHNHAPHTTSPLTNCTIADVVTNDERAKSPDLLRVLSPLRPRRTPKLVNAPEVRWRLPLGLQHMPSLDSLVSSNTSASETSTVRRVPVAPGNIALPLSSASSIMATLPDAVPQDPLLPPPPSRDCTQGPTILSPPAQQLKLDTHFNEARITERPRVIPQLGMHQPHLLSPVTELSSAPSIRSSINYLRTEEVGTAERHPLSHVRRQNVHIIGASEETIDSRWLGGEGEREEWYEQSIQEAGESGEARVGEANEESSVGLKKVFGRLRKSIKGAARKIVESTARKYVVKVMARML